MCLCFIADYDQRGIYESVCFFKKLHRRFVIIIPYFYKDLPGDGADRNSLAALKSYPLVTASADVQDIVRHHFYQICVTIESEKGIVAPVIRHEDRLGFLQIEQAIEGCVQKIKPNRLNLADLEGGAIINGGVYGSLLGTPILNRPRASYPGCI